MKKDFARIITLLRKEKKLSQKQAAEELGVSQALLSHYEKGIRECGLDFVVRAADFYNVSCDYLLGRTAERSFEDTEIAENTAKNQNAASILSRRLLAASMSIIFDQLAKVGSRRLTRALTTYMMLGVYKVFRYLYSASGENPQDMFTVPQAVYSGYTTAAQEKLFADIQPMCEKSNADYLPGFDEIRLSPDELPKEYPSQAAALFNVIQQAESSLSRYRK